MCYTLHPQKLSKASTAASIGSSPAKSVETSLTRQQVCCLLALGFFNILEPLQGNYQQLTFVAFFLHDFFGSQKNKLVCLLKYFERIMNEEEAGNQEFLSMNISVTRKRIATSDPDLFWGKSVTVLLPLEPQSEGLIESAHGCLQVDFANAYIGGGVLELGSEIAWASRWDIYLHMSDVQIHWFAICNSVAIVLFLSGMAHDP